MVILIPPNLVSIRQGREEDADFFFEMELQTTWENLPRSCGTNWDYGEVRESLYATHRTLFELEGNAIFIAEVEEERAGLLWFGTRRNAISGQEEGWIYNLTVCREFRGCGIGKMLLRHVEEYACERSFSILGLSVAVHNDIAQGLYRQLGYEASNVILRKPLGSAAANAGFPGVLSRD